MTRRVLSPGDVLAFPVERIGRFGAGQIVATHAANNHVTVALLDWIGESMPTLDDLANVPRLVKSFMFWPAREAVENVPLPAPSRYRTIGQLPVRGSTRSDTFGSWHFDEVVASQYQWNALPAALTAAFKACIDSDETVAMPGLRYARNGEPVQMRLAAARHFRDDGDYRIADEFRMASLRAWPALCRVSLHRWRDDLLPFLETAPLMSELSLFGHGQREIDLSRTHLERLAIDIDGLERLALPPSLSLLTVHGRSVVNTLASVDALLDALTEPTCNATALTRVVAAQDGRWISVQARGTVPPLYGLDQARGLRMDAVSTLDLHDVVDAFPGIEHLHLFGAPGRLNDLEALTELPKLEDLRLHDLFGHEPDQFPAPEALPALTNLILDSVPAEVAAAVRKAFRKMPRVVLSVRRPRSPEWLSENLDNPLRHWDGREGLPAAVARKARTAYLAALRKVREANAANIDDAARTASVVGAVSEFLADIRSLNRQHGFLYTLERDEVIDAVDLLTARLSSEARAALEPVVENALGE